MIVCCDIDGVLADAREVVKKYILNVEEEKRDWDGFYSEIKNLAEIEELSSLIYDLSSVGYEIFFTTGRRESSRQDTLKWLSSVFLTKIQSDKLFMRPENDRRHASEVKLDWFKELKADIVIDDDPRIVKLAAENGILALQVCGYRLPENEVTEDYGY